MWVNDYVQNSRKDAYDDDFYKAFLDDCRVMINVIHGKQKLSLGQIAGAGSGVYKHDISPWVIGYILGVEWEGTTVAYTNNKYEDAEEYNSYEGKYFCTTEDAEPFECLLARVADTVMEYETNRYNSQRLIAFSNWPTTDPFDYSSNITNFFMKCAKVDVEHLRTTDSVLSGHFASYHVYPYYPDYLNFERDWSRLGIGSPAEYYSGGVLNTYCAYLTALEKHHTVPVVISEFGVSTGRGIAQIDSHTARNQGHMSESEQGQALVDCWSDIMTAGCAGGCVFTWQDEWFKRTWNTMHAVDLRRTPYWSDYQTNEQYFGLLSFDPGEEKSVCYVDGDVSEWGEDDVVTRNGDMTLSVKYDERFVYFMLETDELSFDENRFYIPLDVIPKSGSTYCESPSLLFDRAADFLIIIDGKENSRVLVQERYDALRSTHAIDAYGFDAYTKENIPAADSPAFTDIKLILQTQMLQFMQRYNQSDYRAQTFPTGLLRYGNANPESGDFDSLADFICVENCIELKLPWQLLNFSDPSRMNVHDDYYDGNYGVEYIGIDGIYAGIADSAYVEADTVAAARIPMSFVPLEGWGNDVTYHERLKSSYYIMKEMWNPDEETEKLQ